jgi:2-polyprenyl-3-methyl-5-hydroxy-6-metoxy-1,4-benzoquinol methylase
MFEKLEACPSCGHPKFTNHLICTDHSITGESFALVKCEKCQLVFTNPRPDEDSISRYYESDSYISHANKSKSLVDIIYKLVRNITLKRKHRLLRSLTQENNLLDYGCGTGHFLEFMASKNWDVTGVEPNEHARGQANNKTNNAVVSSLGSVKNKFDIITAWHVIEHVHQLGDTLKALRSRLTDNGHLIIAVPNFNSYDAQYYGDFWAAYDVPRHLYHFSQKSFEALAFKRKLKIKQVLPMKFDSYYVSLLSEKYKNRTNRFVPAIKAGLASNKQAKTTGEYSSLIYVLTK